MKNSSYIGYHVVAKILRFAGLVWFGDKVIGKENIPKKGRCILAGNHLSDFDAYLLFAGTNRPVHFLGKKELFESKFAWFFKMMHLIPVDRKNKNPERQIIPSKNNAKTPANSLYSAPSEHKINGHEFEIISNKVIFSSLKNYFEKSKKKLQTLLQLELFRSYQN